VFHHELVIGDIRRIYDGEIIFSEEIMKIEV